jgi:hypothetical protein
MHVLLRVQYSCGGVLAIWFWWEIDFGVTQIISVEYSCAVVSVLLQPEKKDTVVCLVGAQLLLRPEKKIQLSVWRVHDRYYDQKKKIQSSVWQVRDCYYDQKK